MPPEPLALGVALTQFGLLRRAHATQHRPRPPLGALAAAINRRTARGPRDELVVGLLVVSGMFRNRR